MSLSTRCPHCGKSLKLKSRSAVGKQAPCPGCGEVFTIELAASKPASRSKPARSRKRSGNDETAGFDAGVDDFGDLDDFESDWDAEGDFSDAGEDFDDLGDADDFGLESTGRQRKRRSAGSARKSGKKKSNAKARSGKGMRTWAPIAGGVLLAVLLIGGIGAALLSGLGGENVFDLTWVPSDAELIIRIDPNGMANSPIARKVAEIPLVAAALEAAKAQVGGEKLPISSVSEVIVVGTDIVDPAKVSELATGAARPQSVGDSNALYIVRFKQDTTLDQLFPADNPAFERVDRNGNQCVLVKSGQQRAVLNWFADGRTLIGGTESLVTAAMQRGPQEPRLKRFDFAKPMVNQHLLFIAAPEEDKLENARSGGSDSAGKLRDAIEQHGVGFLVGLNLTSDINATFAVNCRDSSSAAEVKSAVDAALADAKAKFQQSKSQMTSNPMTAPFLEIAEDAVNSLQSRIEGNLVVVDGRLSGRIVDEAKKALETNPLLAGMGQALTVQLKAQARKARSSAAPASGPSSAGPPNGYGSSGNYGSSSAAGTPPGPQTPSGATPYGSDAGPPDGPPPEYTPENYGSAPSATPKVAAGPGTPGSYDSPPGSTPQTPLNVDGGSYDTPPEGTPTETPMGTPGSYDAPPGTIPGAGPAPGGPQMRRPPAAGDATLTPPGGEPDPAMMRPPERSAPVAPGAVAGRPPGAGAPAANGTRYVRVDILVRSYRGSGSVDKAAMRALGRVIGVRKDSIKYDRKRRVLSFVQRFDEKVFNEARTQLARARIQLGNFQVTPVTEDGTPARNTPAQPPGAGGQPVPNAPQPGLGSAPGAAPAKQPALAPAAGGSVPGGPASPPGGPPGAIPRGSQP
ncbi:MAG: hypothetical protein D6725_12285 [Planctomycetota bacterium]|nr:MAG: hypothetical protein D6725_12285 [Planctomycetota bacterium]